MKSRLCTICARGGSQGVPNKNIILINGKPLIAYSIELAKKSNYFDDIAVSSDSQKILDIAASFGSTINIKRPKKFSKDISPKIPAIRHCWIKSEDISNKQYEYIVDLDVTSPLRSMDDLKNSIKLFDNNNATNLITGCISRRSPYFNMIKIKNKKYASLVNSPDKQITRRQDTPNCYDMNASIYIWSREAIMNSEKLFYESTLFYEMPVERSYDIDCEFDLKIVSMCMND
ncbi:acylneuraminate cytidylyltransferase family protein [Pseudomonadota bacterium]|nr:acylneuraminate cytidylyltransferase family protein [Pseudomonadota bacterium]